MSSGCRCDKAACIWPICLWPVSVVFVTSRVHCPACIVSASENPTKTGNASLCLGDPASTDHKRSISSLEFCSTRKYLSFRYSLSVLTLFGSRIVFLRSQFPQTWEKTIYHQNKDFSAYLELLNNIWLFGTFRTFKYYLKEVTIIILIMR